MTDKNDVILAQQGDQQAFARLYNGSINKIQVMLYRWTNGYDDAEDIAQDAMIKALTNINKFKGDSSFHTWAWRIAKNHAINHHVQVSERRPPRQDVDYADAHLTNNETPEKVMEEEQAEETISRVFNDAPDDLKDVFMERMTNLNSEDRELADRLGIPVGTVRSRYFRIKDRINKELGSE